MNEQIKRYLEIQDELNNLFNELDVCKDCDNPCCRKTYAAIADLDFIKRCGFEVPERRYIENRCGYLEDNGKCMLPVKPWKCIRFACSRMRKEMDKKDLYNKFRRLNEEGRTLRVI